MMCPFFNSIDDHANSVVEAWYPGEEVGAAVAETSSGRNNPARWMPVTLYRRLDGLPNFEYCEMANRMNRYFGGKPLYPFGYGRSYTTFSYYGFERVHLAPGASQKVHFHLNPRDLGMVTELGSPIIAKGDYSLPSAGNLAPQARG